MPTQGSFPNTGPGESARALAIPAGTAPPGLKVLERPASPLEASDTWVSNRGGGKRREARHGARKPCGHARSGRPPEGGARHRRRPPARRSRLDGPAGARARASLPEGRQVVGNDRQGSRRLPPTGDAAVQASSLSRSLTPRRVVMRRGAYRSRTGVLGFADPCRTTRPRRRARRSSYRRQLGSLEHLVEEGDGPVDP